MRPYRLESMGTVAITLRVPADELAAIDAEAGENRTQFMLAAARDAVNRLRRERLDAEIGRILAEDAEENLAILDEFAHAMADGLDGDE
jgi:uncharacterized protein (DUF1778 family)